MLQAALLPRRMRPVPAARYERVSGVPRRLDEGKPMWLRCRHFGFLNRNRN